ncbi:tuftelin-interacting protein 11 [Phymastichus coffea]|uniref:tuftelin-interacting protein 11 n=1 Tax=Phymastichus coffea TaxID=108790 RepID=UPI00273C2A5D|nr:tuftelin-interacting protein 11 [Phymastichus coffea]XP_058804470.1 tuftelin-interacting protein 11 [Phymastichus coffea]
MSDEEFEAFKITDYDLDNEFNPNRVRRKMSKKQQMLGIWASDSEDEEEVKPSFSRTKTRKDYSAPIGFVAGGIQQAGKPKEKKEEEEEDEEDDNSRHKGSSSDDEGPSLRAKNQRAMFGNDIAGLRKKRTQASQSNVGNWENYTKGIGSKLMLQMGFVPGKGLGKDLQGINAPIEAQLRKGRGAIGAYGPEKKTKILELKSQPQDDIPKKPKTSQWRKKEQGDNKKNQYEYKTVDEVIESGKLRNSKTPAINTDIMKCNVIDMTTPEQKIFKGYQVLAKRYQVEDDVPSTDKKKKGVNFSLPELMHNLDMIVDTCEQNIIQNDRKQRYLADRIVALQAEKESLATIRDQSALKIDSLQDTLAIVDSLVDNNNKMTLEGMAEAFKELQERHYEEYKTYGLGDMASSLAIPKTIDYLKNWRPLLQPKLPLQLFKKWKDILEYGRLNQTTRSMNPYEQLIWHAWMPCVRRTVQEWACRQPEGLIDLLEYWLPLLSPWIMDNILENIILPKLTEEVEEWNPVTDTVPIHTWIHPWLPLMKTRMDTQIYPIIRRKLSFALQAWHPSDQSARLMLQPWQQVFKKGDMDAFLIKNILPKLQMTLSELVINPHQQHLDHWHWVYDWKDTLPIHSMTGLLDKFFFPKWLHSLGLWLNHTPNYEQVTNWYTGWKGMLSDKLLAEPVIKDHFRKALEMMMRAVNTSDVLQPGSVEQVSYLNTLERQPQVTAMQQPRIERLQEVLMSNHANAPSGFKDIVERRCEERGILFMPMNNRFHDGKQIYKIGNIKACIDQNTIFVNQNGSTWMPMSLNTVLDIAEVTIK